MVKSTRWRGRARQVGRGKRLQSVRLAEPRTPAPDLRRSGRMRLAMVDWHRAHGANVSRTARHFGVSRPTVYRWLARFDRLRLETLEDRSSAPRRRRRPTWTIDQLRAVRAIRETYPCWGKDKLRVVLRRAGIVLSVSMIGRILARLRCSGELREPARPSQACRATEWSHSSSAAPGLSRMPSGGQASRSCRSAPVAMLRSIRA